MNKSTKYVMLKLIIIILFLLATPVSSEEITWDNTKTIGSSVQITAPREFTTCIISPDGGSGWDNCTAYVEVFNNLANFNGGNINLNSIWKKGNVRNTSYQYTKIINSSTIITPNFNDNTSLWENISTPSHIYSGWQSTVPSVNKGQMVAVKILFEKRTWTTDAFDFRGKFGDYEQILDPDVSACGTLSTDGGYYTLINDLNSTGTCLTVGAHNITIDGGNGYWVNYSNITSASYGISNTGYDNITIKNVNIVHGNISTSDGSGIYIFSGAINNTIFNNSIISFNNNKGIFFLTNSNNNNITNNIISTKTGSALQLQSNSNNYFKNNTVNSTGSYGINIISENNITVYNGSILSDNSLGIYNIQSNPVNNTFVNTNFTTGKINFPQNTRWFNYSNNSGITYVSNNVSVAKQITRTIINWNQSNLTWSDKVSSGTATAYYNVTGLVASSNYDIYNNSVIDYTLTTDGSGILPQFTINHTTTSITIKILQDTLTPSSVSSLGGFSSSPTEISWGWVNPSESNFDHTEIYFDGSFVTSTSNTGYSRNSLIPDTQYTLSLRTVDTAGNINSTWTNNTVRTQGVITSGGSVSGGGGGSSSSTTVPYVPSSTPTPTSNFIPSTQTNQKQQQSKTAISKGTFLEGVKEFLYNKFPFIQDKVKSETTLISGNQVQQSGKLSIPSPIVKILMLILVAYVVFTAVDIFTKPNKKYHVKNSDIGNRVRSSNTDNSAIKKVVRK